jgi:OOP family OmpA-OmpF porin
MELYRRFTKSLPKLFQTFSNPRRRIRIVRGNPDHWDTNSLNYEGIDMKIQHHAAVAAFLLLFGLPLNAQADGLFVGASIGNASLDDDFDGLNIDDNSTAYRIVAGWRFNEFFALEGGYHNFGDFEQTLDIAGNQVTAVLSADGFTFGAVGSFPLSERFSVMGRAGMFFWDGNADINNVSQATPEDTNLYLGAGLRFQLSEKLQLTGDWTRYDLEATDSGVLSVGLQYQFR